MTPFAERLMLNLRQLRNMPKAQRNNLIKARVRKNLLDPLRERRIAWQLGRIDRIERRKGTEDAYRAFWNGPAKRGGWPLVDARLTELAGDRVADVEVMARLGLELNSHPLVLANLSMHPVSSDAMGRAMAAERAAPLPQTAERMMRADYAAAFLVATAMTGDDAAIDHALARMPNIIGDAFLQIVESYGLRPADGDGAIDPVARGLRRSGLRRPVRHRLIIAEDVTSPGAVVPLFRGAERVTLIGLNDTFGKAAFEDYAHLPTGEIIVEHVRSRITRFSEEYIRIHTQTRDAAIELARVVGEVPGLVPEGDLAHIELAIADYLFFQVLRIRAVEELLKDEDFDHIVVTFNNHVPASGFTLSLSGVQGLLSDPRVELMSIAQTVTRRQAFSELLPTVFTGPQPPTMPDAWLPSAQAISAQVWRNSNAIAAKLELQAFPAGDKNGSALIVAANNTAYNFSTARYAAALAQDFATSIVVCGGSAVPLQEALVETSIPRDAIPLMQMPTRYGTRNTAFVRWMTGKTNQFVRQRGRADKVSHVLSCGLARFVLDVVQSNVIHCQVTDRWFKQTAKAGSLPGIVIMSAVRSPQVSQFACVARRYGVPSLTMEAHGLNANYSRYSKIASDHYGVISGQFRLDAEKGFAMPHDRTHVIGTPRIVAAPGETQGEARAKMAAGLGGTFPTRPGGVVSFFSQPSNWAHVSRVWEIVLQAAKDLDLQVMLKPHPEETRTRIAMYSTVSRRLDAEDRVALVSGRPEILIDASDVVLTGYSAAALDGAVRCRPVICVTVDNAQYPVDQHMIARVPLVSNLAELKAELEKRLENPEFANIGYRDFLDAEPQFAEGPDLRLRKLVADIMERKDIRDPQDIPQHLFIDPPYKVFTV